MVIRMAATLNRLVDFAYSTICFVYTWPLRDARHDTAAHVTRLI